MQRRIRFFFPCGSEHDVSSVTWGKHRDELSACGLRQLPDLAFETSEHQLCERRGCDGRREAKWQQPMLRSILRYFVINPKCTESVCKKAEMMEEV